MNKKIMILGASILQLPAIIKAKEMGLQVVVVDMNPESVGFKVDGVSQEVISTIDIPAVVQVALKHQINGVMTLASDMPMRTVAAIVKEMGLVGIDESTALKATDKAEMRQALKENNVPVPIFFRAETKSEYLNAIKQLKELGHKCIVKPVDNSGSRGIVLLTEFEDEAVCRAYDYSKQYSRSGAIMVEEFMEGAEVSVETLSIDGVCHVIQITDKVTNGAPYFVEIGHSQPSQLPGQIKKRISEIAIAANHAVGIKNGPSHTEIKVTKSGPQIVEIGARLGGDNITTHLVPLSTGVNMVESCIRIAIGEIPEIKSKLDKAAAIRYIVTKSGVIQSISGINEAKKIPGISQISIVHGVGEKVSSIKSSVDRVGFVIAQRDNVVSAIETCEMALKKIKIVVE